MSVPKSRRNESKIEFDATYFKVMKDAVELTANHFGASENTYINNKLYTDITCKSILECAESLLVKIRIANSIYPQSYEEYIRRRMYQDEAIGICFAILSKYQIAMQMLDVGEQKFPEVIDNLEHEINSLKQWRYTDNRFKKKFKK
jgi:hypothetical protein